MSKPRQEWEPKDSLSGRPQTTRPASTTRMQQATATAQRYSSRGKPRSSAIVPPSTGNRDSANSRRYSTHDALPSSSHRPRSVSTGRIFGTKEDPTAVARSIMELREKREKEQKAVAQRRISPNIPPPPPPPDSVLKQTTRYSKAHSKTPSNSGSDPSGRQYEYVPSTTKAAEYQPSPWFQQSETRNEGSRADLKKLKSKQEELEEMQFFSELESAGPTPPAVITMMPPPPPPTVQTIKATRLNSTPPSSLNNNNRPTTEMTSPRNGSFGVSPGVPSIPTVIRAVPSPIRGGRLPPPKKEILSPRKIAALDRTSLELEAQTLGRHVQILEQEKANLIRTVEMYDHTCQQDNRKMRRLEEDLKRITGELTGKLQEMDQIRETMRMEYETKLQQQNDTLLSTQGLAEELEHELAQQHEESKASQAEYEKKKTRLEKELKNEREELQAQAANFDVAITEVNTKVEKLQQKLKAKDKELSKLREDLVEAGKALNEAKTQKDEAYEVQLGAMQQQLALAKDQYTKLEEENEEQNQMIREQGDLLGDEEGKVKELTKSSDTLKKELKITHENYRNQMASLKKSYEDREKRRLNEEVERRHAEKEEFERRLKSLQEQLTLSTDRHHAEIRQKDANLEARYEEIKRDIEKDVAKKLRGVESELKGLRGDYDFAKEQISKLQQENLALKDEHTLELNLKDSHREEEVKTMREKLAELERDVHEKDFKLRTMAAKLGEAEANMETLRSEHGCDLEAKNRTIAGHTKQLENAQEEHARKILAKEEKIKELEATIMSMRGELEDILVSLSQAKEKSQASQSRGKQREAELQATVERLKQELIDAQSKSEHVEGDLRYEIVKLESKVKAGESSLAEKRQQIAELEAQLEASTAKEARVSELVEEIAKLKRELSGCQHDLEAERSTLKDKIAALADVRSELEKERSAINDKNDKLIELRSDLQESLEREQKLQERVNLLSSLETELELLRQTSETEKSDLDSRISSLRSAVAKLEDEKVDLAVNMSRLEKENLAATEELEQLRTTLSKVNSHGLEMEHSLERCSKQIESLKSQVTFEIGSKNELSRKLLAAEESQSDMKQLLDQKRREMDQLKVQLQDATKRRDNIAQRLSSANDIRVELEETAEAASTELKQMTAKLHVETKEKEALAAELVALKSNYEDVTRDYEHTKWLLGDLERKVSEGSNLASELQLAKQQVSSAEQYKAKNADLQAKIASLQGKVASLEIQLNEKEAASKAREEQLRKLQDEHQDDKWRLQELESTSRSRALSAEHNMAQVKELKKQVNDLQQQRELETKSESTLLKNLHEMEEAYSSVLAQLKTAEQQLQDNKNQGKLLAEIQAQFDEKEKDNKDLQDKLKELEGSQTKANSGDLIDLQMQVEELEASKASLSARLDKIEEDRDRKVEQLCKASERHSKTVEELQSKLEEQTRAKESLRQKLIGLEADLAVSQNQSNLLNDVHARLREQAKTKDALQSKLRIVEEELDRRKKQFNTKGDQYSDLRLSFDDLKRDKAALEHKVEELELELSRKDRQITGIIERQAEDTAKLEEKLKEQTMAKATLQQEIDNLRSEMHIFSDVSSETESLRIERESICERVSSLESALEEARGAEAKAAALLETMESQLRDRHKSQMETEHVLKDMEDELHKRSSSQKELQQMVKDMEDQLHNTENSHKELEQRYNKVNGEKEEVIAALEDVIHEVQSREEEIESLASILRKRDEELDHAKLIATKALASAQEMKSRYKDKGGRDVSDLRNKIEHLNQQLEFLSKKNEGLQRRTMKLESELQQRSKECEELRNRLRNGSHPIRSAASTSGSLKNFHNGMSTDPNGFALMDEIEDTFPSFDDQGSTRSGASHAGERKKDPFDEAMSTYTDLGETTKGWIHDFDNESTSSSQQNSFDEAKSEPGALQSRRSIERDALRKYVRKRYMKHKAGS